VLTCSAFHKIGIEEVWQMMEEYIAFTKKNGYFDVKRKLQAKYWMYETIDEALRNHFYKNPEIEAQLSDMEIKISNDEISSFIAATKLLDSYFKK
jgi:LAO/AO transport system kinase